jgi:hypothetical protein
MKISPRDEKRVGDFFTITYSATHSRFGACIQVLLKLEIATEKHRQNMGIQDYQGVSDMAGNGQMRAGDADKKVK